MHYIFRCFSPKLVVIAVSWLTKYFATYKLRNLESVDDFSC